MDISRPSCVLILTVCRQWKCINFDMTPKIADSLFLTRNSFCHGYFFAISGTKGCKFPFYLWKVWTQAAFPSSASPHFQSLPTWFAFITFHIWIWTTFLPIDNWPSGRISRVKDILVQAGTTSMYKAAKKLGRTFELSWKKDFSFMFSPSYVIPAFPTFQSIQSKLFWPHASSGGSNWIRWIDSIL